uniref:DUF7352 domain-containing protein n=1 Tax=viral metagenome TaxID=1070528 RepID=A0A6M3JHR0_9ZZZZ
MNKQIWKYSVELSGDAFSRDIPRGADILSFQNQEGNLVFWASVDPQEEKEGRFFVIIGTGMDFGLHEKHIGTVQDGAYVWHLFEIKP